MKRPRREELLKSLRLEYQVQELQRLGRCLARVV